MELKISARHGQLSDSTREKIQAKVEKLLRIFDRLSVIEVTVDLEHKEQPRVDLSVSAEHKHDFKASFQSEDLMGSVDQVMHKLEQQLRKYKEKIQTHHRGTAVKQQEPAVE